MKESVIVEECGRCSWNKCIFCSFSKKERVCEPDFVRLKSNLERKIVPGAERLKYFNSGSFLDEAQISEEFRKCLLEVCAKKGVKELFVECRPEYITEKSLAQLKKENDSLGAAKPKIYFCLGLEVADDVVLKKMCKGFCVQDSVQAAQRLKKAGFYVRTYLLANPPYVSDIKKSLSDSVAFALQYSDLVAVINTFARAPAPLFDMWLSGVWSPLDKKGFEKITRAFRDNKKIELYYDDYLDYPRFTKHERLVGATKENLIHPHYAVWQDYISRFYEIPKTKKYALFLPCSFKKPYSMSRTHKEILRRLVSLPQYNELHQLMISNPGVIPREFEAKYPFANYDWPEWQENKKIKKEYTDVTKERIQKYLSHHKYTRVFAYFKPDSESFIALSRACRELGVNLIPCFDKKMYDSLADKDGVLYNRKMLDVLIKTLRDKM